MLKSLLIALGVCGTALAAGANLLENSGFEEGVPQPGRSRFLSGWHIRSADQAQSLHGLEQGQAHSGQRAARIAIPAETPEHTGYFTPGALIRVKSNCLYRLRFHARFQPAGDKTEAAGVLTRFDTAQKYAGMGGIKKVIVAPSESWLPYEMDYFVAGADGEDNFFQLTLRLHGAGTAWFDDVVLEEVSLPEAVVEFYPSSVNTESCLFPIRGEPAHLLVYPFVGGSRQQATLHLDVPECFPLLQAVPVFAGMVMALEPEENRLEGRIGYAMALPPSAVRPMKALARDLFTGIGLLFQAGLDMPEGRMSWSLRQDGLTVQSGEIQLKSLDAPAYARPKQFSLFTWYAPFCNYLTDLGHKATWIQFLRQSGVRAGSLSAGSSGTSSYFFNQAGFRNWRSFWYQVPANCLTGMLTGSHFAAVIGQRLQGLAGYDHPVLNWNYEPNLPEYYHLCDECRRAFEAFAGVRTVELADAAAIEARYPEQYLAFRSSQQMEIVTRYVGWCRAAGVEAMICSYSVARNMGDSARLNLQRRLGKLSDYQGVLDQYLPQVYQAPEQLWDQLSAMRAFYPGCIPVYTSDERHNQSTYPYSLLTPEAVRMEVLMAAAQACQTVGLFVGFHTLDGRQILALRDALDTIATFELFYFDGTPSDAVARPTESIGKARYSVFCHGGQYLLSLFNPDRYQSQNLRLELQLPVAGARLWAPLEKKCFSGPDGADAFVPGQRIAFVLPPSSCRFMLLGQPDAASVDWPVERLPK